ncbi:RsmG family class I SAM-dependent methyltransferase [Siminovitchia fortis]|uniref:RsmG family class I SAM-dependent methyltransferase n=1 Tax=Siminovitchia fortis TaxID=254758 RepID=UPI0021B3AB7B|nr:RsmG family class I SAM-dependent methyltransferase [Siminovitchia fortis]
MYDWVRGGFFVDLSEGVWVCDVGGGGGFGRIGVKMRFGEMKVRMVDWLKKGMTFLDEVGKELKVDDTLF